MVKKSDHNSKQAQKYYVPQYLISAHMDRTDYTTTSVTSRSVTAEDWNRSRGRITQIKILLR